MPSKKDAAIIRELATQVAGIAALPVQEEKRRLWRKLNGLKPERPMVMIEQVCWNEMNIGDELSIQCEDKECRHYERRLRMELFQWKHFPVDMVVEPFITVSKAVNDTGFGITVKEDVAITDARNAVQGHLYHNELSTDDDLAKIKMPVITHDAAETERRMAFACELFGDTIELRPASYVPYVGIWDPITCWMGAEALLTAIMDRPEFMHRVAARLSQGYLSKLDQLEELGLIGGPQSTIHCTGAYTDELPAEGYNPQKARTKDRWMFGLAQILGSVSPAMYDEFEITYSKPICQRFGLVYYGCCEPLHGKMDQVRKLPHVRKVSMSPWADQEIGAEEIAGGYVFSRKPNPALLAATRFDAETIRKDLTVTRDICAKHGCPLELIQKDISTVCYEPQRLFDWAKIAMEVVQNG